MFEEQVENQYAPEAYVFLMDALERVRRDMHCSGHVSSEELLGSIHKMAHDRFGPMAPLVFEGWGIKSSADFGSIVFELVEEGVLLNRTEDTIEDFLNGTVYQDFFQEEPFLSNL
ncbi:MAG: hypothetical protein GY835_21670 [bacterium]|nr:hypothetical protein [bacterium]